MQVDLHSGPRSHGGMRKPGRLGSIGGYAIVPGGPGERVRGSGGPTVLTETTMGSADGGTARLGSTVQRGGAVQRRGHPDLSGYILGSGYPWTYSKHLILFVWRVGFIAAAEGISQLVGADLFRVQLVPVGPCCLYVGLTQGPIVLVHGLRYLGPDFIHIENITFPFFLSKIYINQ